MKSHKSSKKFIKSHNLVNRCYEMLYYFYFFKDSSLTRNELKNNLFNSLQEIEMVETYAKYFENKLKKKNKNIELKCNLKELICDLNFLKQYLEKEL